MSFGTYIKDALWNLLSNKMRSFLSVLWIVIWLFAVIFLMSFGAWAQQWVKDQIWSLITNNITISPKWWYTQRTNDDVHWYVKAITLTTDLIDDIQYYFPELSGRVTYSNSALWTIKNEDWDSAMWQFLWVPIDYIEKMALDRNYGSKFSQANMDKNEDVAIVNKNVVDELLDEYNYPIWEYVYYNNRKFKVIWVLDEESIFWQVYIPITTYQQKVDTSTKISSITVILSYDDNVDEWMNNIKYFLMRKYNVSHIDLAWFSVTSLSAIGDAIDNAMSIFTYLLAAIGSISLLVWWIWIMNIMLVSVTERTREIWIRKAIWALNGDIITQFLIESVVVTAIWWIIAIILAWLAIQLVNSFHIEWINVSMTGSVVALATTLTFLIWIVSWIGPAKKAADLQPIDALRYE